MYLLGKYVAFVPLSLYNESSIIWTSVIQTPWLFKYQSDCSIRVF